MKYCKFENFHEKSIFSNSVKRHIFHVNNSRLGYNLPTSVKDRVILPFCEGSGFSFHEWEVWRK